MASENTRTAIFKYGSEMRVVVSVGCRMQTFGYLLQPRRRQPKTVSSTNLLPTVSSHLQNKQASSKYGSNRACTSTEDLDASW